MTKCFFVTDLHGRTESFRKLFKAIEKEKPGLVFIGGDILPSGFGAVKTTDSGHEDFVNDFLVTGLDELMKNMDASYPRVFLILGNDDGKYAETSLLNAGERGIWEYIHNRRVSVGDYSIYGYSYVPPTPFLLKDWERYDVSRYVDPGCVSPEEGNHTVPVSENELKYSTIKDDLEKLTGDDDVSRSVFLFHSPPYQTALDRTSLDTKIVESVPLDKHIGSIAIRRFIEMRQPLVTLHGHVHESPRITGKWMDTIGRTYCFSAAHDGPELALIRFELENPEYAERELI
jgi:Icc-related predicted phosphoesterase